MPSVVSPVSSSLVTPSAAASIATPPPAATTLPVATSSVVESMMESMPEWIGGARVSQPPPPGPSPPGPSSPIGDVGSFQQLLRDVSGAHGHQQQTPMLSPAAAMFSSFLASPVGIGFGRGVLPTASVSNSEVRSDMGTEPPLSKDKAPNAGSFVDFEGKIFLHVDEPNIAHKPMSFADLLKKSANLVCGKGKLTYYPPVVTELGTRRAIIPDELIQKQASEWALTLAGYFIGKRPAFPFVQYHARRMWKKYGLTDVILNDQGYFFFKFNSNQGLNFVFENGPWLFNGMPIFIQKWQPGLCFDKPELNFVPLWVNIYGLPLDVWDYEIISRIASVVGEPVSVDRYTDEMCVNKSGRANFARVLVNVSADYELPSDIDAIILGKLRKFKTEFLWKPKRCSHCKVFGHDFDMCVIRPRTADEVKKVNPDVGESSKPKDDGFKFPKRKRKPKPSVDPLKVGPKVAFNTGIKINQRYVPKVTLPTIDPLDKGKATLIDENPSPKAPNFNTERIPMPVKVSNQFTVLEEDPQWSLDKKEVDDFIEKRGVGLEPVTINSWSRTKMDYFIGRWERVYGKEPDGTLRGFTLPDRQIISDDDGSDSDSEDDAELVEDALSDATLGTPYGSWLWQKQDIDRRLAERDWPTATQMATWTEKQVVYFLKQCEQISEADRQPSVAWGGLGSSAGRVVRGWRVKGSAGLLRVKRVEGGGGSGELTTSGVGWGTTPSWCGGRERVMNTTWCETFKLKKKFSKLQNRSRLRGEELYVPRVAWKVQSSVCQPAPRIHVVWFQDRWIRNLESSGNFFVASIRSAFNEMSLKKGSIPTCWNHLVPQKVRIHLWRARIDRIPTLENMAKRGIPIESSQPFRKPGADLNFFFNGGTI
ncbi:hypothetical protein OSB04_031800 [Centaurea solstitialis]|uniref:DUF4283 domain-containing protein n=1 Tax=Centaurea solstitialis TaxID=347529 RepID=A0AA38STR2_9ASTR|nr:hypothetical protein OSB04_031800 [Centaurea solstitialis]